MAAIAEVLKYKGDNSAINVDYYDAAPNLLNYKNSNRIASIKSDYIWNFSRNHNCYH